MIDRISQAVNCDRCGNPLPVRTMSWFTEEVICMTCSAKEDGIKRILRAQGKTTAMEFCGFIPVAGRDYKVVS